MGEWRAIGARGFTLLELIVVMLVLAVVAGLAMPTVGRSVDAVRARAEVAGVSALFRHAREQAIALRRVHAVVVDPERREVRVVAGDETRRTRALPAGVLVETSPPSTHTVRFEPHGGSTGGEVRLVTGSAAYRITVEPVTGRVRSRRE
jgi:general secretion pathway protein H